MRRRNHEDGLPDRSDGGATTKAPRAPSRSRVTAVLSWAAFGVYAVWFLWNFVPNLAARLQFEDQLIVLRYARNLAEGNGLVYNVGERVMGFTTPLFTLLSGLFVALGGDHAPAWQNTFGLFCMLGTAAVAARLLVRVGAAPAAPLAVALITFNPAGAYNYVFVGMELHLFSMLLLLAVDFHMSERTVAASIASALLFLTRPEGALLIVMLLAARWWHQRRPPLVGALAWFGVAAPWLVFATIYYGSPVPATLPAKQGRFLVDTAQYLERVGGIYVQAANSVVATYSPGTYPSWSWLLLGALAVVGCGFLLLRRPAAWPLVAFPLASVVGYGALGAWPEFTWHFYTLSVLGALVIALGAYEAVSNTLRIVSGVVARATGPGGRAESTADRLGRATVVATLALLALPVSLATWRVAQHRVEPNQRSLALAGMGSALNERFDDSTSVLVDEIGHVGWESRVRIVDQAGLVTAGLRYDVPREVVVERHRPELLLLHDDAPQRHGVRQTPAFPFNLGYLEVPDFPAAPKYRLYKLQTDAQRPGEDARGRYLLERGAGGQVAALVLDLREAPAEAVRRFAVAGRDQSMTGFLETARFGSRHPDHELDVLDVSGWAANTSNHRDVAEVVFVLGDRVVASTRALQPREDVATQLGPLFRHTGFARSIRLSREQVEREGLVAYALSSSGTASRLGFFYMPLEPAERSDPGTLTTSDGRRLPVESVGDAVSGSVESLTAENDGVTVQGWAADLERGERPRQIVVYRDGRFVINLGIRHDRIDLAERLDDQRLLRVGFRGRVPGATDPAAFAERHRVFAIMLRGAAVELPVQAPRHSTVDH